MDTIAIIATCSLLLLVLVVCWPAVATILTDIFEIAAILAGGLLAMIIAASLYH